MSTQTSAIGAIAAQSVKSIFRERTVTLLSAIFVVLVLVSAYLGWSATSTVNSIYGDAAVYLKKIGEAVPTNPVLDISPLSLLRNLSIYVSLIGALAAIVVGYQLIAADRKSGIVPLVGSRPVSRLKYASGKVTALAGVTVALMAVCAVVSVATFLLLPSFVLTGAGWIKLASFFGLSVAYMLMFGLFAMAAAAFSRSESVGLLLPVTIWLTVTFILPTVTANIHPTAAINPVSALAPAPDSAFFHWSAIIVGPFSVAESFKYVSAGLLDFLPPEAHFPSPVPALADLTFAFVLSLSVAFAGVLRMDASRGDFDV